MIISEPYRNTLTETLKIPYTEAHGGAMVPVGWSGENVLVSANVQMLNGNLVQLSHM